MLDNARASPDPALNYERSKQYEREMRITIVGAAVCRTYDLVCCYEIRNVRMILYPPPIVYSDILFVRKTRRRLCTYRVIRFLFVIYHFPRLELYTHFEKKGNHKISQLNVATVRSLP